MAKAPRPGLAKTRLEPMLGPEGCARLQRALIARAARWASRVGVAHVAYAPDAAAGEVAGLVGPGVSLFAQEGEHLGERLAAAFSRVARAHAGPVVVIGTDQPALGAHHAWAAADDLRAGVDVCLGPATDGGYYLLAAHAYHEAAFAIEPEAWGTPRVMELTLRGLLDAGLSVGWLRSERDLDEPADAAALLADPCAPRDIVEALRG